MDDTEPRPVSRRIARFLDELALGGCERDSPASNLPAGNSRNARFWGYRNWRTAMNAPSSSAGTISTAPGCTMYSRTASLPSGKAHTIAANVEQCAGINLLACQPAFDQRVRGGVHR